MTVIAPTDTAAARPEALALLEADVRDMVRRRGIDPLTDHEATHGLIREAVVEYVDRCLREPLPPLGDEAEARTWLSNAVCGFGSLQPYLDDDSVEELYINAPDQVFVARGGESQLTGTVLSPEAVRSLVERMLKSSGRRLDLSSPFVDASLPDLSVTRREESQRPRLCGEGCMMTL